MQTVKKLQINLVVSIFSANFALAFKKYGMKRSWLAHASGGREVAGSSPVIPTYKGQNTDIQCFDPCHFYILTIAIKPQLIHSSRNLFLER